MIKYVWSLDYAVKRAEYLEWTVSIAAALQEPLEVRRLRSYDNVLGGSPNRVVEFEFDDMESAGRYFDRPAIRSILEDVLTRAARTQVVALNQRGDYTKG